MTIEQLNTFLKSHPTLLSNKTTLFVFITGASAAGKSFLTKALEQELDPQFTQIESFDSIGVPSFEEMIEKFGSTEKWQEIMTHKWVQKLASNQDKKVIILEGQFNPQFAFDACREFHLHQYILILLHADKKTRDYRLHKLRAQPELATKKMNTWAEFLKRKTQELDGKIIDTSHSDVHSSLNEITDLIMSELQKLHPLPNS